MALTPGFSTTGTAIQLSPGAPSALGGSFKAGTSAVMSTISGMPPRTDYTVIPFTPNGIMTQGGTLASTSSNPLTPNDYFFIDGQGTLFLCTTSATVVGSYVNGTSYTLALVPVAV